MPLTYDPYSAPKEMGIYREIGEHEFSGVNAGQIVQRILKSRDMYEERQRVKGVKGIGEEAQRRRETMEEEQRLKEKENATFEFWAIRHGFSNTWPSAFNTCEENQDCSLQGSGDGMQFSNGL
jgi:hypothetical protein